MGVAAIIFPLIPDIHVFGINNLFQLRKMLLICHVRLSPISHVCNAAGAESIGHDVDTVENNDLPTIHYSVGKHPFYRNAMQGLTERHRFL